jgi:hypothetical protein
MKTTVIAATIALALTAGAALADQPMVLTDAQLDQITASGMSAEITLRRGLTADKDSSFTPGASTVLFGVAEPEYLLQLIVKIPGTQSGFEGIHVFDISDPVNPER